MSLFGKKKEEKVSCCCRGESSASENEKNSCCCTEKSDTASGTCCDMETKGICCIRVLGAGCKSCHDQYQNVINAVAEMGIATDVQYVTDMETVMSYGVMSMPAIVVNDTVAAYGKVLNTKDVIILLKGFTADGK